jgi:hypothetical protein
MAKLKQSSVVKCFVAALLEIKTAFLPSSRATNSQYEKTVEHVTLGYENATVTERYSTGASDLDELIGHLTTPYVNGDVDLLESYVKFSVFENPSLPLAVTHLRIASGKHRVIDFLTQEHLDFHARVVNIFKDLISDGEEAPQSVMDRKFNKLAIFVFSNMEHADEILTTVENRKLLNPKDIAAVIDNNAVLTPLMDGVL